MLRENLLDLAQQKLSKAENMAKMSMLKMKKIRPFFYLDFYADFKNGIGFPKNKFFQKILP